MTQPHLTGVKEALKTLQRVDKNVRGPVIFKALIAGGMEIVRDAKQHCPGPGNTIAQPGDRQPTGNLRRSLNVGGSGLEQSTGTALPQPVMTSVGGQVLIGTNVEYGKYVELGTSKMAARPFLLPAAESAKDRCAESFGKAVCFQLDAIARKGGGSA